MKNSWLVALLSATSPLVYGLQAKTPEAALEEIANAVKPETIVRHLPEPVQKSIDDLPKAQKQQVLDKLLSMKGEHLSGCTVRRATDPDAWEIIDPKGKNAGKIKLANVFLSGLDALVSLRLESDDDIQMFMVSMHLEGGDWRIDDFGPWQKTNLRLRQLVHQPSESEKNEAAALETLRKMIGAVYNYSNHYPRIGFPSRLDALTGKEGQEPSEDHSGDLDETFTADPLIINGFRFRYMLTRIGGPSAFTTEGLTYPYADKGAFEIVATPIEFGKTGTRSFLANHGARITWTGENRPATEDDPILGSDDDEN
jgi:hypothetical protein